MRKYLRIFIVFLLTYSLTQSLLAQSPSCAGADPFCVNELIGIDASFPASTGAGTAELGNDYGCLFTQPNPAWYFMEMVNPGAINIQLSNTGNRDIDFALWGPFPSVAAAINECGSLPAPIDCSYSASAVETVNVPANAQSGQVYILVVTNFSNQATTINLETIGGTVGTTNCNLTNPCDPVQAIPGSNSPVCTGGTLELYGNQLPDTIANVIYTWTGPNGFSSNLQNPIIPNVTSANNGNYTLVVSGDGCVSTPHSISVFAGDPTVLVNGTANVCPNGTITMVANTLVPPSASVEYHWTGPNGFTYSSSQFNNVQIPNATAANEGIYTCLVIANGNCFSPVDSFTVNVVEIQPNATIIQPSCGLNNGSIALAPTDGGTTYTYAWTPPATPNNTPTRNNLTANTYTVTITSAGCTTTTSFTLTNNTALSVVTSSTNPTCPGGTGTATVTPPAGAYTYQWNTTPAQTTQTATNLVAGTYTVTVTGGANCSTITSVAITAPPAFSVSTNNTPAACASAATGTASVTASGGNGTLSYLWNTNPPQNTATAANLVAGTYTVTVSDENNCSTTRSVVVGTQVAMSVNLNTTNPSCNNGTNGSITANVSNGTTPYDFVWNTTPIQTAATATNLSGGINYAVTVTDANGCSTSANATPTNPPALSVNLAPTNPLCNGAATGSIQANGAGGTGTLSYSWNTTPTQATATANNLSAGDYTVTVTDANVCSTSASTTLSQPTALNAVLTASQNPGCNSAATGSATVTASGGTGNLSYNWNSTPTQNTASATNLVAGTYTVTISDANACTTTLSTTLTQPTALSVSANGTNPICNGAVGSAMAVANGGTAPYNFVWNSLPPQNSANATNLPANTYTVTVSDDNNCTATTSVTLTQPALLNVNIIPQNPSCFGNTNGAATANLVGGTAPYAFVWDTNPAQNTATATDLAAGFPYTVTVTDANNCFGIGSVTLSEPTALVVDVVTNNSTCNTANGSATASVSNGTTPYSFVWDNNPSTTNQAGNYPSGNYNVTITDANSCSIVSNFNISDNGAPSITLISQTNATCGQANGAIQMQATGGQTPYSYTWSDGNINFPNNTPNLTSIPAGQYTLIVSDANNCEANTSVIITDSTPPTITFSNTINATCGQNNGSVTASGGNSYAWSTTPAQNTATASNLTTGTYTVTITDSNGCTASRTTTITQTPPISLTVQSITDAACGQSNGSAVVTATGGNGLYSFSWNPNAGISGSISNLAAGTYNLTVTDTNNCSATTTVTINNESAPSITVNTTTDPTCGAANGSIAISVSGGAGGNNTQWIPNVSSGNNANNLAAGSYTVIVTDSNGCSDSETISLSNASGPTLANPTVVQPTCGVSNGSISFTPIAGVTYQWSSVALSGNNANSLAAGTYTLTVTDSNNCSDSETVILNGSLAPTLNVSNFSNETCNSDNGSITVAVSNAAGNVTYVWNSTPIQNSAMASNLSANTYTVTITDDNGCTATISQIIGNTPAPTLSVQNTTNETCSASNGSVIVSPTGGTAPFSYLWTNNVAFSNTASNLSAGAYSITVTDANNCTATTVANITNTPAPTATFSVQTNTSCDNNNGVLTVTPNGGVSPYSYSWSHDLQLTANTANNLNDGTYTVVISDANNCSTEIATVLTDTPGPSLSEGAVTDASCGQSNGNATVIASGGTAPLSYLWANGQANATATNLAAGSYIVVVSDANLCTESITVAVANTGAPTITINNVTPANCTQANGAINISASGGIGNLTYAWSGGITDTDGNVSNLLPNTYNVSVTDQAGCQAVESIDVADNPAPTLTVTNLLPDNCGQGSGIAEVTPNGGEAPFSYVWSTNPPQNSNTLIGVVSGNYTVTITDNNNCSNTLVVNVPSSGGPSLAFVAATNATCGSANGTGTVLASNGIAPYQYDWSVNIPNDNTANFTQLPAGVYIVTVTDANGCQATTEVDITNSNGASITNTNATPASCNQLNGVASITVSGGQMPYTYTWSNAPNNNNNTNSNLAPGNYIVTVTDATGCSATTAIDINQTPAPAITVTNVSPETCGNNNGSIDIAVNNGTAPYTYSWITGSTNEDISNLDATNYNVTVTDDDGCSVEMTGIVVAAEGGVTINSITPTATTCGQDNGSISVEAIGNGNLSYTWNPAQSNNPTISDIASGSYEVTVTDVSGCTQTATAEVLGSVALNIDTDNISNANCNQNDGSASILVNDGTEPYTYIWSTTPAQNAATASNLAVGTYTVTVTDTNNCSSTHTIIIGNANGPNATIANNDSVPCDSSTGILTVDVVGGATPYTYNWSSTPAQNTDTATDLLPDTYTVTVTDANLCSVTATATVEGTMATPVLNCGIQTPSSVTFEWDNVTGALSYSLSINGGAMTDMGNVTTFTVDNLAEGETVSIELMAVGSTNCGNSEIATLSCTTGACPPIDFVVTGLDEGYCLTDSATDLSVEPSGGTWSGDGISNDTFSPNTAGIGDHVLTYSYSINGCDYTETQTVNISSPSVQILTNVSTVTPAQTVQLNTEATGNGTLTYTWTPASVACDDVTCADATDTPIQTTTYQVVVTDENGCTASAQQSIAVVVPNLAVFPTAFSPNGDSENDIFHVKGYNIANITISIFNRWGNLVYEATGDSSIGWNGMKGGHDAPIGTYVYYGKITYIDGEVEDFKGNLTLLR
jgi:gliding motility-associated-like protein